MGSLAMVIGNGKRWVKVPWKKGKGEGEVSLFMSDHDFV